MDHKGVELALQVPETSLDREDENLMQQPVAHEQAKLTDSQDGDQEQKKKQSWLKGCKWTSVFIAVTTMLGYVLLNLAISAIAPFYPIWVSLTNYKVKLLYCLARSSIEFMYAIWWRPTTFIPWG